MSVSAAILALAALAAADERPRVFSADVCADQYALALADPADIAALSPDAEKDFSHLRAKAKGIRQARPDAEQVLASRADVVLRHWGGDPMRLSRLGVRVVTLGYAADFDAISENVRRAAAVLGRPERGEALIADLEWRRRRLDALGPSGISAVYVTPGGVTAGSGTMIDAIFHAAGVGNAAATSEGWIGLPLERLTHDPPGRIVAGFFDARSAAADNWSPARHPAFATLFANRRTIHLPADLISCPAWFSILAAEALRAGVNGQEDATNER
jgi:iron complex transport system substrate-binding protein